MKVGALSVATLLLALGQHALSQSAQDYYVPTLPGLPDNHGLTMHAGHIEIDATSYSNLFFVLVNAKRVVDKQRLVIWLNGGPGCSSLDGLFMETGPFRMNADQTLRLVEHGSWAEYAHMLYVDQPVGTGFSFSSADVYLSDLKPMAEQFMVFLDRFFAIFPEYQHLDIYFSGESFAGQYIPYIATEIVNRNNETPSKRLNLQGFIIGNGWIDSTTQYDAYIDYAYAEGIITKGAENAKEAELHYDACKTIKAKAEAEGNPRVHYEECEKVLESILSSTSFMNGDKKMCFNEYDIRLFDQFPSCGLKWPYDLATITPYLRRKDVIQALHAGKRQQGWVECSGGVGSRFKAKESELSVNLLPDLLKNGVRILHFNGDRDLICNHLGIEKMLAKLEWNGAKGFSSGAKRKDWILNNKVMGTYQEDRNMTLVIIRNASHMAPYDMPLETSDMFVRFLGVNTSVVNDYPVSSRVGEKVIKNPIDESYDAGKWDAYYSAGTTALVVVLILVLFLGLFVCRNPFKSRVKLPGTNNRSPFYRPTGSGTGFIDAIKLTRSRNGFANEDELQELVVENPMFEIGDDEIEEDDLHDGNSYDVDNENAGSRYHDEPDIQKAK